jgi:hypothetical protein
MRTASALSVLSVVVVMITACRHGQPEARGARSNRHTCLGVRGVYRVEDDTPCLASRLPRISHEQWSPAQIDDLVAHSLLGVVAVTMDRNTSALVPGCSLLGQYIEPGGDDGSGRMWFANPVAQPLDAMGQGCAEATHVVAAFAVRLARAPSEVQYEFQAILFPLPCPSVTDVGPAQGCTGAGLTGPQRQARAHELVAQLANSSAAQRGDAVAERLRLAAEIAALAPDDDDVLAAVRKHPAKLDPDCLVSEQLSWLLDRRRDHDLSPPSFHHERREHWNRPGAA